MDIEARDLLRITQKTVYSKESSLKPQNKPLNLYWRTYVQNIYSRTIKHRLILYTAWHNESRRMENKKNIVQSS